MQQRTQNFILGLTTISFFALFMATVVFLYPFMRLPGSGHQVYFHHDEGMTPLKIGSPVMLGGAVEKGRVTGVAVMPLADPNEPGGKTRTVFLVDFELDSDIHLGGDCHITTDQPALGGNGFLSIIDIGTAGVPLPAEMTINVGTLFQRKIRPIHGHRPQSFQAAIATLNRRLLGDDGLVDMVMKSVDPDVEGSPIHKLNAILDDVLYATGQVRAQMSPTEQTALLAKIGAILDDVGAMTAVLRSEAQSGDKTALLGKVHMALDQLTGALGDVTAMIQDERPVVHATLSDVSEIARSVNRDILASVRAEFERGSDGSLISKTHKALDQTNSALAQLISLSNTGERMLNANAPAIEDTLQNLNLAASNIKELTFKLLLNPSAVLWPTVDLSGQQAVFMTAQSFAGAASELNASSQRLEAILSTLPKSGGPVPDDVANELERIRAGVRSSFERFERAEESLYKALR